MKFNEQLYIRTYMNNYICSKGCERKTNGPAWPKKRMHGQGRPPGLGKASLKKIFMLGSQNEHE